MRIIKLLLINPATSCSPESSFSTVKSWLRSTMTNQRFNGLALLNVHKECIDQLDLMNSNANILGNIPKTNFRFCLTCFVFLLNRYFITKNLKSKDNKLPLSSFYCSSQELIIGKIRFYNFSHTRGFKNG